MARPAVSDWEDVFGFSDDPTPGDTEVLGQLARSYRSVADNAGDALPLVSGLENQQVGEGKTMEKLRDKLGDLAEQVRKLHSSYDQAAGALDTYVHSLRDQQRNADNALEKGREAKERLASATEAVRAAGATIGQLDAVDHPPDDIEARASTRRAMDEAKSSQSTAQGHADDAQADLDAARLLAEDARQVREEDAATAAQKLDDARDESVAGYSLWDKIKKAFSKALGIISAVLGVLALLIPGLQGLGIALTIGAVVAGAASLGINMSIMAETGDWDIGEIVLGVVGLVAGGGALLKGVGSIGSALKGVARNGLNKIGSAFRPNGRGAGIKKCATDPVDVATGEMLMIKTDLELHGVLPLRLTRTYLSTYRYGQFFGPSWASTLDERLEVDGRGRAFWAREDGSILSYPRLPEAGSVDDLVWPEEGARLPLAAEETAEGEVTYSVADPHTGVSSHFADRPTPGAEDDTRVHWLVRWHDRNGNEVRIEREEDGSPTAMVHSGGYRVEVNCVAGLLLDVAVATPDGPVEVMSYRHDADGNLSHVVNSSAQAMVFDYDDRNRITAWTDRNDSTYRYVYDDANRVTETIGPEGYLSSQWSYDPAEQRNHFTDACGATTTYQLNDLYQVVAETDPLGHTVHTEWDRYDHLLSRTDALGHTTRYEYDQCHNLTVVRLPDGKSSTTAYNRLNQPTVQTQPDGSVWRQEFDERGNLTSLTAPDGTTHHLTRHPTGATATATDPSGGLVRFEADAAGLTVGVDSGSGGTATAERDAFGRLIALTDPFGAVTRTEWTVEGRLARSIAPDGRVKRMSWDGEGNCLSATDSAGGATRYEYTHFDLLAARTGPDGVRYTFAYDAERRLTQVRNPQGLTWDYAYDAAGRLTSESDFDGREVTYTHDASGRLLARTTPLGEEISFQYNSVDEILLKNVAGTTTSYEYDQAGSLVRMASPDSTLEFERDAMGRVLAETVDGRRTGFTYDVLGRRTSRTTPTGAVTELTYDELGNRDSLTVDGHRMAFTHDVLGKEMARVWGIRTSPVEATSDWDPAGRPVAQRLATSAGTLRERTYTYRADDHLAAVTDATTGLSRQMELDQAGRPLAVTADGWTESYAYDQAGNQTSATWPEKAGRAEARGERTYTGTRIQAAGAVRYEYDAAGRMVLRQKRRLSRKPDTWRYEWNAEDQLTSCVTPDGTRWRYTYDPLARRTAKYRMAEDGSVAEAVHFTWDETRLAEQTDTANGITLTWDHDDYRPLTQLERKPRTQEGYDSRFFSIVTDLVGTPTELVDEQGGIAWRSRATLWGVTSRNRDATATTPLRFPGQYQDPETGLHYNYFRHYDPETGRYVSPDPLGLDPAPNPVAYVSNPSTAYDPLGLEDCGHTAEIYILQSGGGYRPWPIRAEYTVRTPGSGEARTAAEATLPRNWAYGNVVHTEHRFSRMAGASTGNKVSIPNDPYHLRAPVARGEAVFMQGTRSPCSSCKGAMNRMANELGVNVRYAWSDKTWDAGGGMKWRE
ncbi:RHS repeat-associated core domain-containing protein [Streptomyces tubercidicus]